MWKNKTLKLWILSKMRFWNCEFLDKMRIFAPVCCINWIQFECISNLQVTQRDWTWNQWAPGIHQHIFNASRNTYKKSTSSFHFNWEKTTHFKTWSFFVPLISYLEISNYHPIWNDYLKKWRFQNMNSSLYSPP